MISERKIEKALRLSKEILNENFRGSKRLASITLTNIFTEMIPFLRPYSLLRFRRNERIYFLLYVGSAILKTGYYSPRVKRFIEVTIETLIKHYEHNPYISQEEKEEFISLLYKTYMKCGRANPIIETMIKRFTLNVKL